MSPWCRHLLIVLWSSQLQGRAFEVVGVGGMWGLDLPSPVAITCHMGCREITMFTSKVHFELKHIHKYRMRTEDDIENWQSETKHASNCDRNTIYTQLIPIFVPLPLGCQEWVRMDDIYEILHSESQHIQNMICKIKTNIVHLPNSSQFNPPHFSVSLPLGTPFPSLQASLRDLGLGGRARGHPGLRTAAGRGTGESGGVLGGRHHGAGLGLLDRTLHRLRGWGEMRRLEMVGKRQILRHWKWEFVVKSCWH